MNERMKYNFIHLGCNANQADAERMRKELAAAGGIETQSPGEADLTIVMTCAFTRERQEESLRQIQAVVARDRPRRIVVSGCLPDINGKILHGIEGIELIHPREIGEENLLDRLWPASVRRNTGWAAIPQLAKASLHRVRVSRGCMGRCSFCVIPRATGPLSSRSESEIYSDVSKIVTSGGNQILLAGEDVGAYGRDRCSSLGALLEVLLSIKGYFELIIESINPQWLSLLLKENPGLVQDPRISRRWYVPVQSGSDQMLRTMRRAYNVAKAELSLRKLRELRPDAYIITDFVIGHPGEEEDDVLASAQFLERVQIDYAEMMKFDAHEGTEAATLPNQIPEEECRRRTEYLILVFLRTMIERLRLDGPSEIQKYLDSIDTLPINTNLCFDRFQSFMAAASAYLAFAERNNVPKSNVGDGLSDVRKTELVGRITDEIRRICGECSLATDIVSRIIRKIPPPRAVALASPSQRQSGDALVLIGSGNTGREQ